MNHSNDERTVRCPVDGCDATPLARGVNLHINRTDGDGHGPRGEVPDDISLENLATVGEREVEMDYPEERDTEDYARLCPYCSQTFAGANGVMIHLGQKAGRDNHPVDPKAGHEPGDFPRVETDGEGNVLQTVDTPKATPMGGDEKGAVPRSQVFRLIADLVADGETRFAQRVRQDLLAATESYRFDSILRLFGALSCEGRSSEPRAGTKRLDDGIYVECRDQSATLSADEARWVATGLELVSQEEDWSDPPADLIAYLRDGAKVLDGTLSTREMAARHELWDQ